MTGIDGTGRPSPAGDDMEALLRRGRQLQAEALCAFLRGILRGIARAIGRKVRPVGGRGRGPAHPAAAGAKPLPF